MVEQPIIGYYGDDFTGSTDVLAQFARHGLRGRLFFGFPPKGNLSELIRDLNVVGIAGVSRSLPTSQMEAEIRPALEGLLGLGVEILQYKICSTFDSSSEVGSIGRVAEIAVELLGPSVIPVLPAQPDFGRFTVFGNHFASVAGEVFRLDRHPTMSRHPTTPMDEADLVRHLSQQTSIPVRSFPITDLMSSDAIRAFQRFQNNQPVLVVMDTLTMEHLAVSANIMLTTQQRPLFVVGSGGLSYGLGYVLGEESPASSYSFHRGSVDTVLVVSGSAAPQTADQIVWAMKHGWDCIRVDPRELMCEDSRVTLTERTLHCVSRNIHKGQSTVLYTAMGPDDPTIDLVRYAWRNSGAQKSLPLIVGQFFGQLLETVLDDVPVGRIVVAGGDTSGYAMQTMDVIGCDFVDMVVPVGPLCTFVSSNPRIHGQEVVLKGGQVGSPDFFGVVQQGGVIVERP